MLWGVTTKLSQLAVGVSSVAVINLSITVTLSEILFSQDAITVANANLVI